MARKFVAASTQLVAVASTPLTAKPLTLSCWFRPVAVNVAYAMVTIDDATVNNRFALLCSTAGQVRGAVIQSGFAAEIAVTTTTYSAGVWAHAAVSITAGVISPYLNGVTTGAVATGRTPAGLSRVRVGGSAGGVSSFDGDLAEIGIWNGALSQADMTMLALGVSPLLVRRATLVQHWPFRHGYSPEIDLVGTRVGGLTNGPTVVAHPRVFLPRSTIILPPDFAPTPPTPGGGGSTGAGGRERGGGRRRRRIEDQPLLYHPPLRRPWEKPDAEPVAAPPTPPVVSPPKAPPPPVVVAPLDFSAERRDLAALRAELAGVQADLDDEADMLDYLDATE